MVHRNRFLRSYGWTVTSMNYWYTCCTVYSWQTAPSTRVLNSKYGNLTPLGRYPRNPWCLLPRLQKSQHLSPTTATWKQVLFIWNCYKMTLCRLKLVISHIPWYRYHWPHTYPLSYRHEAFSSTTSVRSTTQGWWRWIRDTLFHWKTG